MPRATALFDLDGVLVRGDSFAAFMRRRGAVGWRRVSAFVVLVAVGALAAWPPLRPMVIRLVVRAGLVGLSPGQLSRLAAEFGAGLARDPDRVITDGTAAVRRHLASGDRVLVVTATEHSLAHAFLDALGLSGAEVVASFVDCSGRVVHNHGAVKIRQLAARGVLPPWQVAYSDSLSDLPMLRGADRPVLVNPGRRQLARARAALGPSLAAVRWR